MGGFGISATGILNRGGTIGSSSANGTTVVSATNDITNASGRITGNRVAVLAGYDIVNTGGSLSMQSGNDMSTTGRRRARRDPNRKDGDISSDADVTKT
jgi:filamentous hemagglutinin